MRVRAFSLFPFVLFLMVSLVAAAAEPLLTADFEADPAVSGWTVSEDFEGKWNREGAHSGQGSVHIVKGLYQSPDWKIESGEVYRVTFAAKVESGAYWSVIGYDANAEIVGGHCTGIDASEAWRTHEYFFTGPAGASHAQFWFHPFKGAFSVDNLLVERATPEQWVQWAESIIAELPPVNQTPPADRWESLPKTAARLRAEKPLRILVIGDSVANDLADSNFHLFVQTRYKSPVVLMDAVSGNAGASWFLQEDRVQTKILAANPDLVLIAGMSHKKIDAVRQLVAEIRAGSDAEVLMLSGTVVQDRYRQSLKAASVEGGLPSGDRTGWRQQLSDAARQDGFAFFDLGAVWDAYTLSSSTAIDQFKRDNSHLNTRGRMVMGQIMQRYFTVSHH